MKLMTTALFSALVALPVLAAAPTSGLKVGETVSPFHPTHIAGPNKGTDACPPCTYGDRPQVMVWVNHEDEANIVAFQKMLGKEVAEHQKQELKAFVVNLTNCEGCVTKMDSWTKAWSPNVGLAHISSGDPAVEAWKVNISTKVKNTVLVYKNRKVVANFVNLVPNAAGAAKLEAAIHKAAK